MGLLDRLLGKEPKGAKKEPEKEVRGMAKDPVCGMTVDEKKAPAKSDYKGNTYYFCSVACKKAFDQNPAKYTEGSRGAAHSEHHM